MNELTLLEIFWLFGIIFVISLISSNLKYNPERLRDKISLAGGIAFLATPIAFVILYILSR